MRYGSIDGVKDTLPRFAKYIVEDSAAGQDPLLIKQSTVEQYLDQASSQIDAALSGQYPLPLLDAEGKVPELINTVANNLAAYKVASRYWASIGNEENQSILALRKDAKEILANLESGEYVIPGIKAIGPNEVDELEDFLSTREDDSIFDLGDPVTWLDKL